MQLYSEQTYYSFKARMFLILFVISVYDTKV